MLPSTSNPFQFVTQHNLISLTGLRARDLAELLEHLKKASGAVVYYHTHHFLRQHQFLSPEPPNDFAYWVTNVLQEEKLGEQLAAIDTVRFPSIRALQEKLVNVISAYLTKNRTLRTAPDGEEFHFMKAQSFCIPIPHRATNLQEFREAIKNISVYSLYYHIFEARIRLGKETNDFSLWLDTELGEKELAKALSKLDPYTQTMENLRKRIATLVEQRLTHYSKETAKEMAKKEEEAYAVR